MCGIAGIVSIEPYQHSDHLDLMRDALRHRGPDGSGSWWSPDRRVGLAHRRLAILDLSPTGAQPMASADGALVVTFNGEIYNHNELRTELIAKGYSFRGSSDTEVLVHALHAWGDAAIQRLSGMFAFAVYDQRRGRLMLARDRVGEKPLFWGLQGGLLVFASELKGLMARPGQRRTLSAEGLDLYLAYGSIPAPMCILDGLRKLPPAHVLTWDLTAAAPVIQRYWDLPRPDPTPDADPEALADQLHALLRDSVRRQLAADVPVGVLLSGGVDSSLITAIAAEVGSGPVHTFTVGFPGHATHDERPFARRIASHFGTRHTELEAESGSLDLIETLARQFDEPMCDSSMIPMHLVSGLVRKQCSVVLGGDGADELFGGYRSYQGSLKLDRIRNITPRIIGKCVKIAAIRVLPTGFPNRNGLIALGHERDDASAWGMFFDSASRRRLSPWLAQRRRSNVAERSRPRLDLSRGCPGAWMAHDFCSYLPDDILVKVDRASMLNSLEVRTPFLSTEMCSWAFSSVPNVLRTTTHGRKVVPKTLARRLLPADFNVERKQGFTIPLKYWLDRSEAWSMTINDKANAIFNEHEVKKIISGSCAKRSPERVFMLKILNAWINEYAIDVS